MVVGRVVLVISSCIPDLNLIEQGPHFYRKSVEAVTAFINVQLLATKVIVGKGNLEILANVYLRGYYEVTENFVERKFFVGIG